jgi:hypothetical protein
LNRDDLNALLRSGIEAARNNNAIMARDLFRQVLEQDPDNELAWMWMAQVVDSDTERREALQNVLRVNPENERARDALQRLGGIVPDRGSDEDAAGSLMARTRAASRSRETSEQPAVTPAAPQAVPTPDRQAYPREMWSTTRGGRDNSGLIVTLSIALVAIGMIILGLILLIDRITTDSDDEDSVASDATTTETVVALEDTAEPTATRILLPTLTPIENLDVSPAPATNTPTDTPEPTSVPTATPVPEPPGDSYKLLFLDTNGRLNTIAGDGSGRSRFTFDVGDGVDATIGSLAISPDGQQVVFSADLGGVEELFVGSVTDPEDVAQLTTLGADSTTDADWSPDGQQILFASNVDGDYDLYVANVSSGAVDQVTDTSDLQERHPSWSPDGQLIAYDMTTEDGFDTEIFVLDRRTVTDETCQLTEAPRRSFLPRWSPDGHQIAFLSNRSGAQDENDVFVMQANGSAETLVTVSDRDAQDVSVEWSPDSRWLAVSTGRTDEIPGPPQPAPTATGDGLGTLVPTPTPEPIPQVFRLWLWDVDNDLWYQITDDAVLSPVWLGERDFESSGETNFTCTTLTRSPEEDQAVETPAAPIEATDDDQPDTQGSGDNDEQDTSDDQSTAEDSGTSPDDNTDTGESE